MLIALFLLTGVAARAQGVEEAMKEVDFSAWQQAVDEADGRLDVAAVVESLASGKGEMNPEALFDELGRMISEEIRDVSGQLIALCAPALLWAVNRQLSGRLGAASALVCYLAGSGAMLTLFAAQLQTMEAVLERIGGLTGQVFPVLSGLMSATGQAGTAGLMQPLFVAAGGALTGAASRIGRVLGGGAAVLAVIGNLTDRVSLKGLHRLCCSVGSWLLGGMMTVFLGLSSACGAMGRAQDGLSIRAARYAADHLLPVVGGDVADTMEAMASGALAVRGAAGVTGALVLTAVCLRPVVRLALNMLLFRLAAAITEPAADGPLKKCMEQLAQASQLLLVAAAVCMSVFFSLIGVVMGGVS